MRHLLAATALTVVLVGPAWADGQGDLKQAKEALKKADYATARVKSGAAIETGGLTGERLAEAYRTRATAEFQMHELQQAFNDVSQALTLSPRDAAALGLRCQIQVAGGNAGPAEADLAAARQINAKSSSAQVCEAGLLLRQRKFADAVAAFDKAIALGETDLSLRATRAVAVAMSGKPQEGLEALDKVIAAARSASPTERAEWLADRARLYASLRNTERAVKDMDESLRLDPNGREATDRYFLRARIYADAGQFDKAIADLDGLIQRDPNAPPARRALLIATRGSTYAAKGTYDKAVADLDTAIGLGTEVPPAVVGSWTLVRARANRAAGKQDAALQDYATAMGQLPNDLEVLGERGEYLLRLGKADKALEDFQAAAAKAPNAPAPYSWLGWGYAEKANYPKAIESASKVIELRPQEALGYWDRGVFKFLEGRFAESTADLDQAAMRSQSSGNAMLLAHIARARAGDVRPEVLADRAKGADLSRWPGPLIRLFMKEISPEDALKAAGKEPSAETLFFVGQYYLLENQPKRAAELFRKVADTKDKQYFENTAARIELKRLKS